MMKILQKNRLGEMIINTFRGSVTTSTWIIFLICLLSQGVFSGTTWAEKHLTWSDYREPFKQKARVLQNRKNPVEKVFVEVVLPERFIKSHKTLTLVVDIQSNTDGEFKHFKPYINVNDKFRGSYKIPVTSSPKRQIQQIEIKSEHLQPGSNTLKAFYNWNNSGTYCTVYGCGYTIHKMYFKDAPPIATPTPKRAPTPSPSPTPDIPTPTPTPSYSKIQELLSKGDEYFDKRWFTTPDETNSFDIYKEVLAIDPANEHARERVEKILYLYKSWGNNHYEQADYDKAVEYYEKYLMIADYIVTTLKNQSIEEDIQDVRQRIKSPPPTPTSTATPEPPTPLPSPTVTPPVLTPTPTPIPDLFPIIQLTASVPGKTSDETLELQGVVTDDTGLDRILIHTPQKFIRSFTSNAGEKMLKKKFTALVQLNTGRNEITIEATDLRGQTARQVFDVFRVMSATPTPSPTPAPEPIAPQAPVPESQPSEPIPEPQPEVTPAVAAPQPAAQPEAPHDSQDFSNIIRQTAHTYVAIIGIGTYQDDRIPALPFVEDDTQSIYHLLTDRHYSNIPNDRIKLLIGQDGTARAIKRVLGKWLHQRARAEDVVLIYYVGHHAVEEQEHYWVPFDADLDDLYSTALRVDKICEMLQRIQSKSTLLFVDSYETSMGSMNPALPESIGKRLSEDNLVIMRSSGGVQASLESEGQQPGDFASVLIDGLQGRADTDHNGVVTIEEIWSYLDNSPANLQQLHLYGEMVSDLPLTCNIPLLRENYLIDLYRAGELSVKQFAQALEYLKTDQTDQILEDFLTGRISLEIFKKTF